MDSDEEGVVLVNNTAIRGELIGYRFEPRGEVKTVKKEEVAGRLTVVSEEPPQTRRRDKDTADDWCSCGKCRTTHLVHEGEYVCCNEEDAVRNVAECTAAGT